MWWNVAIGVFSEAAELAFMGVLKGVSFELDRLTILVVACDSLQ